MFKINKNSIFFTLFVVFILSFLFIIFSFSILIFSNQKFETIALMKKYHPVARMVLRECHHQNEIPSELHDELKNLSFLNVSESEMQNIFQNGELKVELRKNDDISISVFKFENFYYLSIQTSKNKFLLKDNNPINSNTFIIYAIFGFVLLCFVLAFAIIFRKLYPILGLTKKVKAFGNEKFDIKFIDSPKRDEISLLESEFKKSVDKLSQIREARNIFIRNIMHEFKTPITKGRFLLELPYSIENRAIMEKVFYRLEGLINEFASIEELMSTNNIIKKEYFISDIIDNSVDLLIDINDEIKLKIDDFKIYVDFKLFSIALKNLIDNAIKYSIDKKIEIEANENFVCISNFGVGLKYPLEYYFEPFKKESSASLGFGLGIYITNYILKAHNFRFEYFYNNGLNKFLIRFK